MSPASPPQSPKSGKGRGKTSSYRYFSRLSKRFFKPRIPPGPIESQSPPQKRSQTLPTQRLCSLRRKSNHYFATQARNLSPPSDLETLLPARTSPGRSTQTQPMHDAGMGNQQSAPVPSKSVSTPSFRPKNMSSTDTAVERSGTTSAITNTNGIDSVSAEVFPQRPLAAVTMKRPLPPPQSRDAVREEARRALEVVDVCGDAEDAVPTAKRAKVGKEVDDDQHVRTPVSPSRKPSTLREQVTDSKDGQRLHLDLGRTTEAHNNGGGGGCIDIGTGVQIGNRTAGNAESTSETPKGKKKRLFGTLGANGVPAWANHQILAANGDLSVPKKSNTGLQPAGILQRQHRSSGYVADRASQPINGPGQEQFRKQPDSMFVDEGYGSFSVPGDDNDGDDDRVPENEDELMKRINGSLGLSSPFVQNRKAEVKKPVTWEQANAEKQRERDVEKSRRMREANLAAKADKSKQTAKGGGGLSVGFLENLEPREDGVDPGTTTYKGLSKGIARSGYYRDHHGLVNGSKPILIQDQGQGPMLATPKSKIANRQPENMSHAALLDIAENHVNSTSQNSPAKSTQRSSENVIPSGKPETDTVYAGLNDRQETQTGFIRALEQQLNVGGSGAAITSGAYDWESRQSIISQLTPKRKERQELNTPEQSLPTNQQKSHSDQLQSEARLLELRNSSTSNNISSVPETSQALGQEGSLLDQLVRRREGQAVGSAENSASGQESRSTKRIKPPTEYHKRYDTNKRAKATVEAAEVALLRMGVPASLFEDWRDQTKCMWASREEEYKESPEKLKKLIATRVSQQEVARQNGEQNADLSMDSQIESQQAENQAQPTGTPRATPRRKRKLDTRTKHRLDAAIAVLSDLGFPASVVDGETNREIIRLAMKYQLIQPTQEEMEDTIARLVAKQNARPKLSPNTAPLMGRKVEKPSSDKVAAAEAILRDMGLSPSDTADWTYQKKITWAAEERRKCELQDAISRHKVREKDISSQTPPPKLQEHDYEPEKAIELAAADTSEFEESEEEDGWECAIRWQGTGQPKTLADAMPSHPVATKADLAPEEPESEDDEDEVEKSEKQFQLDPNPVIPATAIVTPEKYRDRQAPDPELLRQMQQRNLDDWSDEKDDEQVHEYVVKADAWGMLGFPAHDLLILGRYLDKDKAEQMVRDFILRCKPAETARSLEIQTVWSNGNFSQKMICDGEAGCRAFVEPELVSARKYPDLTEKVARRKTYAVLFERTISRNESDGGDGEVEEDIEATTIDDMQVFTTKNLANWEAKRIYLGWHEEHLNEPKDKCWLMTLDENLCQHVQELNEEGLVFNEKQHITKGGATDTMNVWIREIAPKGPRN